MDLFDLEKVGLPVTLLVASKVVFAIVH